MNNREASSRIVAQICNALNLLPGKEDWEKLVDFTERQIENQVSAQQNAHPTLGILAAFQAFIYAVKSSVLTAFRHPPQRG